MGWFTKTKPKPGAGPALKQTQTFKFQAIRDKFSSVEEVQQELRKNGLESSQLIVGIDFTKVTTLVHIFFPFMILLLFMHLCYHGVAGPKSCMLLNLRVHAFIP